MAPLLREMDAAVFPNRAEGGTNLVAMECMACGVPSIVSANTGHLDLMRDGACVPLTRQGKLPGPAPFVAGTEGWGESDVDEIVAALEALYADRARAAEVGRRGAALMAGWSWANQARLLKEAIRPVLRQAA
jgi:glycosyltransferase involved in cell wall biosynthesis